MIVKLKSTEVIMDGVTILKQKGDKLTLQIPSENMISFFASLRDKGIENVKIKFEEEDHFEPQEGITIGQKEHFTQVEYLEHILADQLMILREDKNIKEFFKRIGFVDDQNLYYKVYTLICDNHSTDKLPIVIMSVLPKARIGKGKASIAVKKRILKASLKTWLQKYDPCYTDAFSTGISYSSFIKVLLKNTDRKY